MTKRAEIEALLDTLPARGPYPLWARQPETEVQFYASILAHLPEVTPIYDENDELVEFKGITLKK